VPILRLGSQLASGSDLPASGHDYHALPLRLPVSDIQLTSDESANTSIHQFGRLAGDQFPFNDLI